MNAAWSSFTSEGGSPPSEIPTSCLACVTLSNGPSFQYGLWNVLGAGVHGYSPHVETDWFDQSHIDFELQPGNAFLFLAESWLFTSWGGTNFSTFQWTPNFDWTTVHVVLPVGNYTVVSVQSEFDPLAGSWSFVTNLETASGLFSMVPDLNNGVYTPLWAFNTTGLQKISSGVDGLGDDVLFNNEYANIGQIPDTTTFGATPYFPWFGLMNDYGFPVFPGILLSGVDFVDVTSAPSFTVAAPGAPSYDLNLVRNLGWPETNNLQMFIWESAFITLASSTITGWWPAVSFFGLSQSFANVVFWNTSFAVIDGNLFSTGGMALFLYGGEYNEIEGNVFETGSSPPSANPSATVAETQGSIGLVDADWGDAYLYGAQAWFNCVVCDEIYNNAFITLITADSPSLDPYTGNAPGLAPYSFSQAWNFAYTTGSTNIIGGNYIGGNYWWDYGYADNPYGYLPDVELSYVPLVESHDSSPPATICVDPLGSCDQGAGDYYPLVNVPIYNITFKEQGLPTGTEWEVEVYVPPLYYYFQDEDEYNYTLAPKVLNFTESAGDWYDYPYTGDPNYAAFDGNVTITNKSVVVLVKFQTAYKLTFIESGLPSMTDWDVEVENYATDFEGYNYSDHPSMNVSGILPGTYEYYSYTYGSASGKYIPSPNDVYITVSANATVHITFAPVYRLSVHAVGLPSGWDWYFSATGSGANYSEYTSDTWYNVTVGSGTYSWQTQAVGYAASPSSGTLPVTANTTLTITFVSLASATGALSGTVTPALGHPVGGRYPGDPRSGRKLRPDAPDRHP